MFNLLRNFFITSIFVGAVIVVAGVLYRQHEVNDLISEAEHQNVTLAQAFANSIWPRFSSYVISVLRLDGDDLRARPETGQIHDALRALTYRLPVIKVKIYNLDGLTVYSTEPGEFGERNISNPGYFVAAREGRPASKLSYKGTITSFSGTVHDRDLVESYIPIRQGDGPVEAVFELYTDVTELVAEVEDSTSKLAVGFTLIFGLLYGFLFIIVRRADRTIKSQYADITEKNTALRREIGERQRVEKRLEEAQEGLERRVEERTRELTRQVAERRAAEAEAKHHREGLARIGRVSLLGELATSLAHELNQPLAVISGCVQVCTERLRTGKDALEPLLDALEQARSETERASNIVRGIQRFARKERSERRIADVNDVIRSVAGLIETDAREHGIALVLDLAESLPPVSVESTQIEQVVLNLAHNGMESMTNIVASSPQLTIRTRATETGVVEITVRDEGKGIPAAELDRIFEPLFTTKENGLGMGLSISRSIIEAHGGALWANSDSKAGVVLHFTIPIIAEVRSSVG